MSLYLQLLNNKKIKITKSQRRLKKKRKKTVLWHVEIIKLYQLVKFITGKTCHNHNENDVMIKI